MIFNAAHMQSFNFPWKLFELFYKKLCSLTEKWKLIKWRFIVEAIHVWFIYLYLFKVDLQSLFFVLQSTMLYTSWQYIFCT